ncbi:Protein of unknown function [Cotesia congregata]|uniref:Uncharacterized protein n=1 Tax=Cotesia congregata TaxID=51543 RepID=A0A8J2HE68_COTCN|nr:Protein of unknown function [Cotesia congregata]
MRLWTDLCFLYCIYPSPHPFLSVVGIVAMGKPQRKPMPVQFGYRSEPRRLVLELFEQPSGLEPSPHGLMCDRTNGIMTTLTIKLVKSYFDQRYVAQGPRLPVRLEFTTKIHKRRYESKSTEDLSLDNLRKKAKELDQITTSRFEKFLQKNKTQFIPNLNRPRSRTSSQTSLIDIDKTDQNEDTATSGFEKPKRTVKRTIRTDNVGASTSNTFNTLEEHSNEEIEKLKNLSKVTPDGKKLNPGSQHTTQQNKNAFRAKSRPPPIHVQKQGTILYLYPQGKKKVTLVLKGVTSNYNEHDVKNFISNKKLQDVNIEKVTKLQFDKKDPNRFFFLVYLSPDSKAAALTKLRYVLNQPVRWEKIKKKAVFQCRRCQRIGHAKRSYANTTNLNMENFPALPRRENRNQESYWNDTPNPDLYQSQEATQFDGYNSNIRGNSNNFSQIENMMINFKNSLTEALKEQFNTLNKQITENSRRIDYILSQFDF